MLSCPIVLYKRPERINGSSTGNLDPAAAFIDRVTSDRGVQLSGRPPTRKFFCILGAITRWIERLRGSRNDLMSRSSVSKFLADIAIVGVKEKPKLIPVSTRGPLGTL